MMGLDRTQAPVYVLWFVRGPFEAGVCKHPECMEGTRDEKQMHDEDGLQKPLISVIEIRYLNHEIYGFRKRGKEENRRCTHHARTPAAGLVRARVDV